MAEYRREQRNQLSRAIANSETGSRQLKEFVDNRHSVDLVVQCRPRMLECETEIIYRDKEQYIPSKGKGKNNSGDALDQIHIIEKHPQTQWITSVQELGNKHGVCAEPHSLANALKPTIQDEKNIKEIYSVKQSSAEFVLTPDKNLKAKGYKKGDTYPPCKTCMQWVPKLVGIGDNWTDFADVAD